MKAILFDFDGVIVDSVNVKAEAFRALFAHETEQVEKIVEFHLANGGMSRFIKFEIIYRNILKRPLTDKMSVELGERFSELVKQKVVECPYIPGAIDFIQKYAKQFPIFVASGTPHDELTEIFERRKLTRYFLEIHGTPQGKAEIAKDILARYGWRPGDMPFIGDAVNDYNAALEAQLPFYGFVYKGAENHFPAGVEIAQSYAELEKALNLR